MRNWCTLSCLVIALGLASACGAAGGSSAGGSTMQAAATNQATAALAQKLGISPALVELALAKARSLLSGGASPAADKGSAALAGVEAAAAQAQADGKPLAEEQKSGLLDGLKNLL